MQWVTVNGRVVRGHRVASQPSRHYPRGTIALQKPHFRRRGLDLSGMWDGTLNVSIAPRTFAPSAPAYTFRDVAWTAHHPPEHFSFSRCRIEFRHVIYDGWVYYPHPETKQRHFQNPSLIEILAARIEGVTYGAAVTLWLNAAEIALREPPETPDTPLD